jgi:hypothetical protein
MKLKLASLVIVGALGFSGCAYVSTLEGTTVSPTQVIVAGNSFDAIEATATNYIRLPLCPAATLCRTAAATKAIVPAVRAARTARSQMEAYVNANPGSPAPVSLYNTAITAINALESALAQYNVN